MASAARSSRSGGSVRRARRTRGFGPLVPLLLLALVLLVGWAGARRRLRPEPEALRVAWIDPAELAWGEGDPALDPRWRDELEATAAAHAPFRSDDAEALEALREDLEALSFVARVPELRCDAERGLSLALELREPVACVPVGSSFLTVDAEGVLLPGSWPAPLRVDGAPLPVLGPMSDAEGLFLAARPGDWLCEPEHLAALDVALSLRSHLALDLRRRLGGVVIDATHEADASADEPGVRLLLEGRRLVLFGRRPSCGEPGELPVERKWHSLEQALTLLQRGTDWEMVDVRWDEPEIALRGAEVAALDAPAARPAHAARSPRRPSSASARRGTGPRVR